ncbi:MAG: alpha/beta fold hydrolase [Candidatus Bathyarchaeia archaeon]
MPYVTVNGVKIFYERRGVGPPLYVLHGGPGFDHTYFGNSLNEVERAKTVYYIDFRGHGLSDRCPPETYRFSRLVDDVEGFRRSLDHTSIDILGHSMGGMIALLYALTYPEALNKLILVATGPRGFRAFIRIKGYKRIKISLALLELKNALRKIMGRRVDLKKYMLDFFDRAFPVYGIREESWPQMRMLLEASIKSTTEVHDALMPDLRKFNVTSRLPEIRAPTLTILGENDVIERSLLAGSMLEKIPNSKFVIIPNAGHHVFLGEPERFNQEIVHFLSV